ncbi:CRISPR-associated protein Cas7 [Cyclobacterium sp. 1_MG-2023]|uniref:CRISPR-associated protein Cas7 n=1 Tax=Cyclobacterium sp. 1_MG-2023 TaxID=3062681 RepID=UPI0026E4399C|nr:CRISPR-associated protein Cas7 [Cyclobacterium sp. 1_MG-2023]MDO6436634.1 CRISPR-associated protein Cas7 [Cyclobacterium sp. 1_MG-2023]
MNTIYIRTLKRAEHTVFNVSDGQKYYYDSQFGRRIPYSSGQQVKRSMIDSLCDSINQAPSPTTFLFDVTKQKELKEGEVYGTCDPRYADQLFGGWMKAAKGGKDRTLKRRSPLSISAMRALHPMLAGMDSENASFDRSERPNNKVIVRDEKGNELSEDQIVSFLEGKDRSLSRKWIPDNRRATGLFVFDVAIDLRRLFNVSVNSFEPEMSGSTIENLKNEGWVESVNVFGPCLVAPHAIRKQWIEGLAHAIINWRITSNQSRTFSLMDTLAVSVSDNANLIAGSIRAKLSEEDSKKAEPIVDENINGVDTFITLQAGGFIHTKGEQADALEKAEQKLVDLMMAYDYENQVVPQ